MLKKKKNYVVQKEFKKKGEAKVENSSRKNILQRSEEENKTLMHVMDLGCLIE